MGSTGFSYGDGGQGGVAITILIVIAGLNLLNVVCTGWNRRHRTQECDR